MTDESADPVAEFSATLSAQFKAAMLAKPLVAVPGGTAGWTPEQVIQEYERVLLQVLASRGVTP